MADELLGVLCKFAGYCPREPGSGCLELACLWAEVIHTTDPARQGTNQGESGWVHFPEPKQITPTSREIMEVDPDPRVIEEESAEKDQMTDIEDQLVNYLGDLHELREFLEVHLKQVKNDLGKAEQLGKALVKIRLRRLRDSS